MARRQAPASALASPGISRSPVGLDADAVVSAALALIDEDGVAAFTMRRLSDRLGVSAPTLYWHVGSKAQLFESVVTRVVTDMAVIGRAEGTWEERLRRFLTAARARLLAHPEVMEMMRSVHTPAFEEWTTIALDIMSDAGFDEREAAMCARAALFQVIGSARSEANVRTADYMELVPGSGSGTRYRVRPEVLSSGIEPRLAQLTSYDLDEQHEVMTDIFIAGLRSKLERASSRESLGRHR